MIKNKYFIYLTFVFISSTSISQTRLSIDDAVAYGLEHSIDIKTGQADYEIAKARNSEITASAYPQVSGSSGFNYYYEKPTTLLPGELVGAPGTLVPVNFVQTYGLTASLQANQILFDPSVMVGLQARNTILDLANKKLDITQRDLKTNIIKAYYAVLIGRIQTQLIDNNIDLLQKLTNTTTQIYKSGFAEKLDVDRLQVNLNNLKNEKIKIQSAVDIYEALLKYQMTMPMSEKIILTDSINYSELEDIDSLLNIPVEAEKALEYSLLQTSRKLNEYDIKRYKLSHIPTLVGFVNYGINAPTNTFNYFNKDANYFKQGLMGLNLSVPIFNGMATKARLKQATLKLYETDLSIESLENGYHLQNVTLKTNLKNSILTLKNSESNMKLAEEVYKKTQKKYEIGVGSNTEVIQANNDYKTAQNNYYQAIYTSILAKTDLLKALNQL